MELRCRPRPVYLRYWLRPLGTGLLTRRSGFDLRSVLVWFVVDEVALGQVIMRGFCHACIVPQMIHTIVRYRLDIYLSSWQCRYMK